jgi:anti-sigma B factor antagonist
MSLAIDVNGTSQIRVHLTGRLDSNTAPALDKRLDAVLAAKPRAVVFDLAQLEYISSAGLRCVLRVKKAMAQSAGQMLMVNLQPSVQKVFDVVKAVAGQNIFRNVQELDDYLDKLQKNVREGG